MHEQHGEDQDRAAHAGAAELPHVDVAGLESGARDEQKRDTDHETSRDGSEGAFVNSRHEKPDDGRNAHKAHGQSPERRTQDVGVHTEPGDRQRSQAGGERGPGPGQREHHELHARNHERAAALTDWLLVVGCIFGINLLPAFGPPTWAVLVFFRLNSDLPAVPLILVGALAAASGRLVLAATTRHFRSRFSAKRRESLQAAEELLVGSRARAAAGLGLFALSPVPSAQLFVAAGLLTVPLVPLTAAFFVGRLVSYSLYVAAASAAKDSLGDVLADAIGSPIGIAVQVLMLAGLVLLVRVDWTKRLPRRSEG